MILDFPYGRLRIGLWLQEKRYLKHRETEGAEREEGKKLVIVKGIVEDKISLQEGR